jgi:hypothetical protein
MTVQAKPRGGAGKEGDQPQEFLRLAWLASLGFLTINLGGITYLSPCRLKKTGGKFDQGRLELPPAGKLRSIPQSQAVAFEYRTGGLAVYKVCSIATVCHNWDDRKCV